MAAPAGEFSGDLRADRVAVVRGLLAAPDVSAALDAPGDTCILQLMSTSITATSPGQAKAFAQELQQQVYQLNRILGLVDQHSVAAHGTTVAQTYTLLAFPADGTLTMHELSVAMNLAGSTMTRVVDRLVANALAERAPDDEDRRIVRVSLTDTGRELRALMESIYQDLFERVAQRVGEQDRAPFLRALRQVVGALSEVADCC